MFHTTKWLEHDQEASTRAHEEPIEQLRDQVRTMEANLETLTTRSTQVADLRDAQGLREGQRALTARLTEMEECASVQTPREFMTKILRIETLVCGDHGGIIGEAIRACNMRLDNHKATMDDSYARIRTQDGIMTYLIKKAKKRCNSPLPEMKVMTPMLRISQEWRIVHLVGVEPGAMRHSAESRDKTLDHHKHQGRMTLQL